MAVKINKNSLLFLYEGDTEAEFYKTVFDKCVPPRVMKRNYGNLKGVYSLNDKVRSKIESYLRNESSINCNCIHVFIAYDREGPRLTEPNLDIDNLICKYIHQGSRIISINQIIATQDLESWFFHDLDGIYKFLKVVKSRRNLTAYNNIDSTNNRILSELFHRFGKHYQKGKRVQGFIDKLDIEKIISNVPELSESITLIQKLCEA
ncbi:MAG TPA: hypothetical protein VFC36_00810 [Paludibacter sp.]|nr:hypothetical protein [Paludibacter sp.]